MKQLRFSKDQGSAFYKELNRRVNAHFSEKNIPKHGNRKMLFKIGMYFTLDIVFFVLMLTATSPISFCVFYLLMGLSVLLTAFNVSHDAIHGVAVKSPFWNKVLYQLSFNLQGNNAYVWGKNHNESHHLYTNVEGSDIDVLNNPLIRMTETQDLKWYYQYQHIYAPFLYLFYTLNWFLFRELLMILNISSRTIRVEIPRKEVVKLVFFKLLYIAYMILLPMYVTPLGWEVVPLAFFLNHFMTSIIFTAVLGVSHMSDFVQHPEPDENGKMNMSWASLQLCTSVDYNANSSFFNWTLGGFNAHTIHHLLPNVCHIHYIDILPIFREVAEEYGITYMEMDYSDCFASHFRFLKKMGAAQALQIRPYER